MKIRKSLLAMLVVLSMSVLAFAADDPNVGSWKLNESKSKIPAGAGKNTSVTYTAEGDQYKCVTEGTDAKGNAAHSEWTGKFDGKDYAVTGDPNSEMRSLKMTSPGHYAITNKKGGKTTLTGTVVFSKDGKTRTLTTHGTDDKGKKWTATYVFEKQS
jgi:hypothetical protein